ncbi:hypothetical protein KTQ89_12015 [Holdemanella porci]|uniref:hypothetical protein n=1 Tax=Holdemanella porci TaxID=2652276 RepID=UPI001C2C6800|nr:hypothetical protein [Holdemanella porci]MBU9873066.1 hypothetical protein [Holdemanella porci]
MENKIKKGNDEKNIMNIYREGIYENKERIKILSFGNKLMMNIENARKTDSYKKLKVAFSDEQIFKLCIHSIDFISKYNCQMEGIGNECTNVQLEIFIRLFLQDEYIVDSDEETHFSDSDIKYLTQYIMDQILCERINNVVEWHNDFSEYNPRIINFIQRKKEKGQSFFHYDIKGDGLRLLVNSFDIYQYLTGDIEEIIQKRNLRNSNLKAFFGIINQREKQLVMKKNEILMKYDLSRNDMYDIRFFNHKKNVDSFLKDLQEIEKSHDALLKEVKQKVPNFIDVFGLPKPIDYTTSSPEEIEKYEEHEAVTKRLKSMIQLTKKLEAQMNSHWHEYESTKKEIKFTKPKKKNNIFKNYLDEIINNRHDIEREILSYISSALPYNKNKKIFVYDEDNHIVDTKKRTKTLPINIFERKILDVEEEEDYVASVKEEDIEEQKQKKKEKKLKINKERKLYADCLMDCLDRSCNHTILLGDVFKKVIEQMDVYELQILHSGILRTLISTLTRDEKAYLFGKRFSRKSLENQTLSQILYESNKKLKYPFKKIEWTWNNDYTEILLDKNRGVVEKVPNIRLKGLVEEKE